MGAISEGGGKVRVLWLIKGLGPGGAEQLLVASAHVADRGQLEVEVAYVRPDKMHLVGRLEESGVPCHLVGGPPRGASRWPLRLRALLDRGEYDVVHAHSPLLASSARLLAATIPVSRRPVVVTTEHNVWGSHSLPTRWLNGLTSPLDKHRWAVSEPVRDSMWSRASDQSEVLIHGIALAQFAPTQDARQRIRRDLGIPGDAVVASTVANLRRQKDYPNLLAASRIAIEGNPHLYVLAVGQGPLEAETRELHARLGLGARVQLLGYRTDVADVLAASDIFVLASEHEGLPLAMMEAMAAGLPVVATAVGGVPDAIDSGVEGVLVPARDSGALAAALLRVAGDTALAQSMGAAAREASARFDIRIAVARQSEVYEQLAAARRARRPGSGAPRTH